MTDDRMASIQADVERKYEIFDAERKKLIAAYQKSKTPKAELNALVKLMRHHASYVGQNILMSGWQTDGAFNNFAERIEAIARDL
jgi:hypothetical protein